MAEVVPGMRRVRLPVPFRRDHVSVWAIDTRDGWRLVDTGLNDPGGCGRDARARALEGLRASVMK
ncbi:hypothetical protein [Alicycliphilus denitrificans]|uniref:hypothetical protein n=1 Tax=Alicycliphilus denitrificans TaxID=179636 RepID=UPI0005E8EF61|nr:hypothetical protein [Alicycliphilus denitrificans]GAO21897.1 hypothetical protein ALISP_1717 [Alicycliphilus sp. B1]GAO22838.1 hypothetical protein ALISP_2658 [Alicycliphilus sp. B1]